MAQAQASIHDINAAQLAFPDARIVGVFTNVSYGVKGAAFDATFFYGVDLNTGKTINAHAAGTVVGLTTLGREIKTGHFGFSGEPEAMGGASVGVEGSLGNVTFGEETTGVHRLAVVAYNASVEVTLTVNGGYTFSVWEDVEQIYFLILLLTL